MTGHAYAALALASILAAHAHGRPEACNVRARTAAGWVCGLRRRADDGSLYASFRGVPYAKQPIGDLRFKELESLEPWDDIYDARNEGPICYQTDILYGRIMQPRGMSEACIYANIHVPIEALPNNEWRLAREVQSPRQTADEREDALPPRGLPILVFIHGGGFSFGSGDADLHGPEYLVSKKVILITFNYRLNVFGFLSLNTSKIPGNAGLRDMVTLLHWVQRNARAFGGDPNNVTLAGQSAGSIAAHLLTLSKAAEGLFKRTILMSGTAVSGYYSSSPFYAQFIQKQLIDILPINATDSDDIHQQLIDLPAEKLHEANSILIDRIGLTTFVPTVETFFPGVTPIVDDYPDILLSNGRGNDIPLLVGYTDSECETFRNRLEEFDIVQKAKDNPLIIIPPNLLFTTLPNLLPVISKKINKKYYSDKISVDGFVKYCTDAFFEYPVLKLMKTRGKTENAPMYVYRFTYNKDHSVIKDAIGLNFQGAGHIEDLTYLFKANSIVGPKSSFPLNNYDDYMTELMTSFVTNFMTHSKPKPNETYPKWPATTHNQLQYQDIRASNKCTVKTISYRQQELTKFFDTLTTVE